MYSEINKSVYDDSMWEWEREWEGSTHRTMIPWWEGMFLGASSQSAGPPSCGYTVKRKTGALTASCRKVVDLPPRTWSMDQLSDPRTVSKPSWPYPSPLGPSILKYDCGTLSSVLVPGWDKQSGAQSYLCAVPRCRCQIKHPLMIALAQRARRRRGRR